MSLFLYSTTAREKESLHALFMTEQKVEISRSSGEIQNMNIKSWGQTEGVHKLESFCVHLQLLSGAENDQSFNLRYAASGRLNEKV